MSALLMIGLLLFQQLPAAPSNTGGTGVISGRVVYADGSPVVRALLSATPVSESGQPLPGPSFFRALSSATGDYAFQNLPAGRYTVQAQVSGVAVNYTGPAAAAVATILTVIAGSTDANRTITLPPSLTGVRLSGRVVRPPNQAAAPGVTQVVMNGAPLGPIAPDGGFEILHVLPGTFTLSTTRDPGIQPVRITVSDRDIFGIELQAPRLFDVTGTVTVENASRASQLPPITVSWNGVFSANAPIMPDGTFTAHLLEGEYRLGLSALGDYYLKSAVSDSTDLLASPLKIAVRETPIRVALTLAASPGVKISGRVTGDNVGRVARKVSLTSTLINGQQFETTLLPDGTFEFPNVRPGPYAARVTLTSVLNTPPVSVVVPNKELRDLEIAIPSPKEITGRIGVQGNGPPPKFSLFLIQGTNPTLAGSSPTELATPSDAALGSVMLGGNSAGTQIIQLSVSPLPDGTFKLTLPESDYRVVAPPRGNAVPPAYVLRSLTYGGTNLFIDPLHVTETDSPDLHVEFEMKSQDPWVKLSGKVSGFDAGQGLFRVGLEGDTTATVETIVSPDGTFEFPRVPQATTYTARLLPLDSTATSPRIAVANKDVANIQIVVPAKKEVTIRTIVENGGPLPGFMLTLAGSSSTASVIVKPDEGGVSKVKLPEDSRRVSVDGLPLGYSVKSMTYDVTDLRKNPLKITDTDFVEIKITLTTDPSILVADVKGRVTGLDPDRSGVRIAFHGASSFATFEEAVSADGSFSFPKIPQGTYFPSLIGAGNAGRLTPSYVTVSGPGAPVELTQRDEPSAAVRVEEPTGVILTESGANNRSAAYGAAAVATSRTINTAEVTYLSVSKGQFGSIPQMIAAGLLPSNFTGPVSGFIYSVVTTKDDFALVAVPVAAESGTYAFYVTPDGVVRYSTFEGLAPLGQAGAPVSQ